MGDPAHQYTGKRPCRRSYEQSHRPGYFITGRHNLSLSEYPEKYVNRGTGQLFKSIISTEDPAKISLAEALVKQVHSTFDYSIGETTVSGYTATVTANITTFDSDAILENYQKELDSYLASVDAVIDGAQKRYEKSYSLLLEYIEENTATKTVETTFTLINDGASWKLEDAGTVFGQALFGTLSSSPVEDKQETNG